MGRTQLFSFHIIKTFAASVCLSLWIGASPTIAQSGGPGGPGGGADCRFNGNNYGTIICNGGAGGNGGNSSSGSTSPGTLAPSARATRVVTFVLTNNAAYQQNVKFFSVNRVWPSDDRAYVLNTREPMRFRLDCEPGEKVCYGAFYSNGRGGWGAGQYGDQGCTACCAICRADREVTYHFRLGD